MQKNLGEEIIVNNEFNNFINTFREILLQAGQNICINIFLIFLSHIYSDRYHVESLKLLADLLEYIS